jgi:hypothetical protein
MAGGGLSGGQQGSQMGPFVPGGQPSQYPSPQYITNQQDQMIRQGFGRLGLAGVGMGPQQINPMMYDRLATGFASGQINPGNFQDQLYNVAQTMNPAAATPAPTPAPTAAPRTSAATNPANSYYNPFQQSSYISTQVQAAPKSSSKGSMPGMDEVNLSPSQDTLVNRLQDLQLSQISGARPSGERQFFQPVYQAQYENYASPMTAFNVASYGTNPFMAQDIMSRGYQDFYAPPPSFYVQNPAYVEPTPIAVKPSRNVPGSAMRGITSLLRSGKR